MNESRPAYRGSSETMNRRQRLTVTIGVWLIAAYIWLLRRTCRFEPVIGAEHLDGALADLPAAVPCGWHQYMVASSLYLLRPGSELQPGFLISPSRDGEYSARVVPRFGGTVMRGSATRTGAQALRSIYQAVKNGISPVIHADGPTGPPGEFKTGAVMLARMTGVPMVPIGCAVDRYWAMNSWDRLHLPKPFARIAVVVGEPRYVGKKVESDEIDALAETMGDELDRLTERAEAALRDGR